MKLRTLMKIAVISSVVLLCTGFVMYSFFKLSAAEGKNDFNLYTLVPPTTTAVLETDDLAGLIEDVNELNCSKENHFLYVSRLFSLLKQHLYTLLEDTPHGLSRQMNKVLLSFHEPDNDRNQVLYCSLGSGDYALVEKFITKYCSSTFPSKIFDYKGEEIRIYPMPDGTFLACYFTSRFLVVSYQKKLVEEVIDARLSGKSLLKEVGFEAVHADKKTNVAAAVYVRMQSLEMGKLTDGAHSQASLGGWTEFEVKMKEDVLYFSGTSHDTDTCLTFMNMLRKQQAVQGFPDDRLPATTFFFSKRSVSNLREMFAFTAGQEYATVAYSESIKSRDAELLRYLEENGGQEIMTCLFQPTDTTVCPAAVMSIPIADAPGAERVLKNLIATVLEEEGEPAAPRPAFCTTASGAYPLYVVPRNTLFTQLTGITESAMYVYACFYAGSLLLAPDADSLLAYIGQIEKGQLLDGNIAYEKGLSGLSDTYHFMLVADLEAVFAQPESYVRLVPSFFFRNATFFRHFILSTQFTCADGVVYPNVVLLYKGGKASV